MFDKSLVVDQRSVTVSELAAGSTNEIHILLKTCGMFVMQILKAAR